MRWVLRGLIPRLGAARFEWREGGSWYLSRGATTVGDIELLMKCNELISVILSS